MWGDRRQNKGHTRESECVRQADAAFHPLDQRMPFVEQHVEFQGGETT